MSGVAPDPVEPDPGIEQDVVEPVADYVDVSGIPAADGRFAQIGGFTFRYEPAGTAQVVTDDGTVTTPGTRVQDVTLGDGTVTAADYPEGGQDWTTTSE